MSVHDRSDLRDRSHVFHNRLHAGSVLVEMVEALRVASPRQAGRPLGQELIARIGLPIARDC